MLHPQHRPRFGTDGIRGLAETDLTDELVSALGRATARVLGCGRDFLIARDPRQSGPRIERSLAAGLTAEGCTVEVVGVFPTPGLAYLSQARDLPAAMISASHNPFQDNGIKLFAPGGRKLPDEVERRVEVELDAVLDAGDLLAPVDGSAARVVDAPAALDDYLLHLESALQGRRLDGLAVVVDCANGAASTVAPLLLERLGAAVEVIHAEPDGVNINTACGSTHPDDLRRAVGGAGAQAGIAFDGDADRMIAVDERGDLVDGDHFLAIAALDLRQRGALRRDTVVATVMANLGFRRAMAAHDISVVETQVGDRYVLEAMDEGGYGLGGEQSGHVIFADLATTGDGILSAVMLLDALARAARPLSEVASVVQKLPQVLVNARVRNRAGLEAADDFWDEVRAVEGELGESGRVLVRPSGTEPLVRIMGEAPTDRAADDAARRLADRLLAVLGEP